MHVSVYYTYLHIHVYICTLKCTHKYIQACMLFEHSQSACIGMCVKICMYTCEHSQYACIGMCVKICMYTCEYARILYNIDIFMWYLFFFNCKLFPYKLYVPNGYVNFNNSKYISSKFSKISSNFSIFPFNKFFFKNSTFK